MQIYYKGNVTSSTIIRQKVVFNLLMLQSCMEALELRKVQVARKQASLRAATFSPLFLWIWSQRGRAIVTIHLALRTFDRLVAPSR